MSRRRTTEHVRIYSPQEICVPRSSSSSGGAVHKILTERKCWRIAKGKDEVVWPPNLEVALVEGLEKYEPRESRSGRAFGRFPNRNKFVANHILKVTGKWRTPKQVGSRIQQLRDTDAGKTLLKRLSDRHYEIMCAQSPSPGVDECCNNEPEFRQSPPSDYSAPLATQYEQVVIDILPESVTLPHPCPSGLNPSTTTGVFHSGPRHIRNVDPTVTFTSLTPISAYSAYRVFQGEVLVHAESTPLSRQERVSLQGILYSTTLVPQFWNHLCNSSDPTSYTILQEIVHMSDNRPSESNTSTALSVVYRFSLDFSTPSSSTFSPSQGSDSSFDGVGDYVSDSGSGPSTPELYTESGMFHPGAWSKAGRAYEPMAANYLGECGYPRAAAQCQNADDCGTLELITPLKEMRALPQTTLLGYDEGLNLPVRRMASF